MTLTAIGKFRRKIALENAEEYESPELTNGGAKPAGWLSWF